MAKLRLARSRQTVYQILRRRGIWQPPRRQEEPITAFEAPVPNGLWQVDLIELAKTALGEVYALVVEDDHSRYLIALRFLYTKHQEEVLYGLYLAFGAYGLPARILVDRGSQFWSSGEEAENRFLVAMERLGVEAQFTSRPQTKGKVEKLIQFVERDLLGVQRERVRSLEALNTAAETWREQYNRRPHEAIHTTPSCRYRPSDHRVAPELLWEAFAREERRKVRRDGTVHFDGCSYAVPSQYVWQHVWVRSFGGRLNVCAGVDNRVVAAHARPP